MSRTGEAGPDRADVCMSCVCLHVHLGLLEAQSLNRRIFSSLPWDVGCDYTC